MRAGCQNWLFHICLLIFYFRNCIHSDLVKVAFFLLASDSELTIQYMCPAKPDICCCCCWSSPNCLTEQSQNIQKSHSCNQTTSQRPPMSHTHKHPLETSLQGKPKQHTWTGGGEKDGKDARKTMTIPDARTYWRWGAVVTLWLPDPIAINDQ